VESERYQCPAPDGCSALSPDGLLLAVYGSGVAALFALVGVPREIARFPVPAGACGVER
jgi:hypothetical protein